MIAANVKTEEKLMNEGWQYSHTATVNRYEPAGSVSKMQTRKGFEFCRVHVGKTVGKHCWQITYVYYRQIAE